MVPLASSLVYQDQAARRGGRRRTDRHRRYDLDDSHSPRFSIFWLFEMSRGDFLSLLCAVTFALHIVVIGHFAPKVGFESLAVVQIAVTAAAASALSLFAEPARLHLSLAVAAAILITGVLATALAFTTQAWAQQYTSATRAALIFALEPVAAWLTSYTLTGETMTIRGKVGAGIILAGILLVECTRLGRATETSGAKMAS